MQLSGRLGYHAATGDSLAGGRSRLCRMNLGRNFLVVDDQLDALRLLAVSIFLRPPLLSFCRWRWQA